MRRGKKKERNPKWKQGKERKTPKNIIVSYSHQISTMYNLWKERYLEKNNYKYHFWKADKLHRTTFTMGLICACVQT